MFDEVHQYLKTHPSLKGIFRDSQISLDVKKRVGLQVSAVFSNLRVGVLHSDRKLKAAVQRALDEKYPFMFYVDFNKGEKQCHVGFEEGTTNTRIKYALQNIQRMKSTYTK